MKVVILAGGEGKRLRPLTDSVPKPLVKVGGVTIIDRQIEMFGSMDVDSFIVLAGYKHDVLLKHFEVNKAHDVQCLVESAPRGTGGAIRSARDLIGSSDFIVVNGDIVTNIDLRLLLGSREGVLGKIALVQMRSPYGVVKTKDEKVAGFEEKPLFENVWINAGFYWFDNKVLEYLPAEGDIERTALPKLAEEGVLGFHKFEQEGVFWRSVDTIKDYEDAERFVKIEKK